ncbi:MAG: hypothetical protein M3301_07000 [Chloroflexota bacterium]|nr:hypothetical protein [Chloroflexota bacterium]
MLIQLDCPWCDARLDVNAEQLDGEVRCHHCSVAFALAPDREPETVADAA